MKKTAIKVKTKLISTSGVSILIALVLFLVAAMVSAVVISSAYTAFKSVYRDIENEQDYLSVSSAARLIGESLADTECTITKTEIIEEGIPAEPVTTYECTGPLGAYIVSLMDDNISSSTKELTVSLDSLSGEAKEALSPAPCKFRFTIDPVNDAEPGNSYKITGCVTSDSFDQKIWITAYAVSTGDSEERFEDTDQENHNKITITTTKKYKWSDVRLNSVGGTND